jgi:hypothetical protein
MTNAMQTMLDGTIYILLEKKFLMTRRRLDPG